MTQRTDSKAKNWWDLSNTLLSTNYESAQRLPDVKTVDLVKVRKLNLIFWQISSAKAWKYVNIAQELYCTKLYQHIAEVPVISNNIYLGCLPKGERPHDRLHHRSCRPHDKMPDTHTHTSTIHRGRNILSSVVNIHYTTTNSYWSSSNEWHYYNIPGDQSRRIPVTSCPPIQPTMPVEPIYISVTSLATSPGDYLSPHIYRIRSTCDIPDHELRRLPVTELGMPWYLLLSQRKTTCHGPITTIATIATQPTRSLP